MTALLVALAALVPAALLFRRSVVRRYERECLERLRPGADGIVPGARPIDLPSTGSRGVLLLHGFGDTPQTFTYLAPHLHAAGYGVRAPLLPGHGRTLRDFDRSRLEDWVGAAREEYAELCARYDQVAVVGLSMGGAIATLLAAEAPHLPALVLAAPFLSTPPRAQRAVLLRWLWGPLMPYAPAGGERSIHDEEELARSLAYGTITPRTLHQLHRMVRQANHALPRVTAPTLMVQSRHDNRIAPPAAEAAFARLGAQTKQLVWLDQGGHVITVDISRARVLALITEWLDTHLRVASSPPVRAAASGDGTAA